MSTRSAKRRIIEVNDDLWNKIVELADKNGHDVWAPTHAFQKGDETIGGCSINGIPVVWMFFSKEESNGRDVVEFSKMARELVRANGWPDFAIALPPTSPLYQHRERFGLTDLGEVHLCYGKIN
jgi:hypothetical protein